MISPISHAFVPNSQLSVNVTGPNRCLLILVQSASNNGTAYSVTSATLGGTPMTIVGSTNNDRCNIDVCFLAGVDAGTYSFVPTFSTAPNQGITLEVHEYFGVSGIADFTSAIYGAIAANTSTKSVALNNLMGKHAIVAGLSKDDNTGNTSSGVPDVIFDNGYELTDGFRQVVSGVIASVPSNAETYDLTFNDSTAGGGTIDGFVTVAFTLVESVNQPPIADDANFGIYDTIQNGEVVGTFTATDTDGIISGYSIDNPALAINNSGLITIADNTGITAGVNITATVTATDNQGDTDTALITITVTEPLPGIVTVTPVRLGETVSVTVDNAVNLATATTVTATYGGIAVTVSNIAAGSFDFIAPSAGLEVNVNHDLIVTADGQSSPASSQTFLPPTGWGCVVIAGIADESFINDPDYIGNVGGNANNISIGDQFLWDTNGGLVTFDEYLLAEVSDPGINQINVSWFYLEAQESYASGATAVVTLFVSQMVYSDPYQITLEPPEGKQAILLSSVSAQSPANGILSATDWIICDLISSPGGYAVNVGADGIITLSDAGVDETQQTVAWSGLDTSNSYAAVAGGNYVINLADVNLTAGTITSTPTLNPGTISVTEGPVNVAGGHIAPNSTVHAGTIDVGQSNVEITAGTISSSSTLHTSTVQNIDETAPVITLTGPSTINLTVGDAYAEQGATWDDNVDGTGNAIVSGDTVNTQAAGTYTIRYNYSDAAGNAAAEVTRTVIVQAQVNTPTISANTNNPMPSSIVLNNLAPYQLSQHVVNPQGKQLRYTVSGSGAALNTGVSLNQNTGELSLTSGQNSTVNGIIINVEEIWN